MPDLGTYTVPILSAYAISLGLIIGIIFLSILRSKRVAAKLAKAEARANGH